MIKLKKALDEENKVIRLKMDILKEQDREIKDTLEDEEGEENDNQAAKYLNQQRKCRCFQA